MNIDRAVEVLNENGHNGFDDWKLDEDGDAWPSTSESYFEKDLFTLSKFEAIAIAEAYERQAGRDYPETRKLIKTVDFFLGDQKQPSDITAYFNRVDLLRMVTEWKREGEA